jgi:hypothetical protein
MDSYEGLVPLVAAAIAEDDTDQSQKLAECYLSADAAGRALLDDAFTCLCGWRLETLLKRLETGER